MKKILPVFFAAFIPFVSCDLNTESVIPSVIMIYDDGYGSQSLFSVYANGRWGCSVSGNSEGISVEPMSGQGETLVTVTIAENTTGEPILSYINFTCGSAKTPTEVVQLAPSMTQGDCSYPAVKAPDGQWWTAVNLLYLPEGKQVSKTDFSTDTGVWYPCDSASAKPLTDAVSLASKGYFYSGKFIKENSLCPEGWHLPSANEWRGLIEGRSWKDLDNAGLNLRPMRYVTGGKGYSDDLVGFWASSTPGGSEGTCYAPVITGKYPAYELTVAECAESDGINVRCIRNINLK